MGVPLRLRIALAEHLHRRLDTTAAPWRRKTCSQRSKAQDVLVRQCLLSAATWVHDHD